MKTNKLKEIKNALIKITIFIKSYFKFRKKIESELSEGYFICEDLYGGSDSTLEKRYYRIAVKYYLSLANLEDDKESLLKLAASYFVLKRYKKTIETLTKAVTLFPVDINDFYLQTCFGLRAWAYCLNGNYKESIADYTRCKAWDISYHWCYFRGQAHFRYKHYYEAVCDFSEVLKHQKFWSAQLYWRAKSYIKLKEYTRAVADYTTLIEDLRFEHESRGIYLERGKLFRKIGKYDKAKNDFRLAKIIDKQNKKEIRLAKKRRECCG
jgi:tetratricopeptide (TPR) repeat protein